MRRRLGTTLMLLLAIAAGCGTSNPPTAPAGKEAIRVETLGVVFNRGSTVQLDLVNDSTLAANGKACAHGLQILVGGDAWGQVPSYDASCDAILLSVQPGERKRVVAPLPATLSPGTYRTVHELSIGVMRIAYVRYSAAFIVR